MALTGAPVLLTEHLRLRGHVAGDHASTARLWADPNVIRHISAVPATSEAACSRLLRYRGHWALLGFGYWLVETREGAFVGEVGLADYRRDVHPQPTGPEAGWVLAPDAQGKGLAREAMQAVLGWADATLDAPSIWAMFDPAHERSIALAGHLGFGNAAEARYGGNPALILTRQTPAVA